MSGRHVPVHQIELRIASLPALFNSMDPTPFHHRDLDADAEAFLESWALEFPAGSHYRIVVHIGETPAGDAVALISEAIRNHFSYKALLARRGIRVLLLEGRTSLLIGLGFLALCVIGADLLGEHASAPFLRALRESLIIGGWVAMWRPLQIFLYDWWPLARRMRIYRNLGAAAVQISAGKA